MKRGDREKKVRGVEKKKKQNQILEMREGEERENKKKVEKK